MIGIFDSGVGGLRVLQALLQDLPGYDYAYFGDTARAPYGTKHTDTIIDNTLEGIGFMSKLGAAVVVLACNTIASVATASIQKQFKIPVVEFITPAAKLAVRVSRYHRIGLVGSPATVLSGTYQKIIQKENPSTTVCSAPCPMLVPLIEAGWLRKPETKMIIKKCLLPLKVRQIDTLILGCTHYSLLLSTFQAKAGKRVALIDPIGCVADSLKSFLSRHRQIESTIGKNGALRIMMSDVTSQVEKTARSILKKKVPIDVCRP
jgi:glutamate racemase